MALFILLSFFMRVMVVEDWKRDFFSTTITKIINIRKYSHNGVVVIKISNVIHLINMIKLSVYVCRNFTLNLLKHFIFPTFLNELLFTISDNIFQLQHAMKDYVSNFYFSDEIGWVLCDWLLNQYSLIVLLLFLFVLLILGWVSLDDIIDQHDES